MLHITMCWNSFAHNQVWSLTLSMWVVLIAMEDWVHYCLSLLTRVICLYQCCVSLRWLGARLFSTRMTSWRWRRSRLQSESKPPGEKIISPESIIEPCGSQGTRREEREQCLRAQRCLVQNSKKYKIEKRLYQTFFLFFEHRLWVNR